MPNFEQQPGPFRPPEIELNLPEGFRGSVTIERGYFLRHAVEDLGGASVAATGIRRPASAEWRRVAVPEAIQPQPQTEEERRRIEQVRAELRARAQEEDVLQRDIPAQPHLLVSSEKRLADLRTIWPKK